MGKLNVKAVRLIMAKKCMTAKDLAKTAGIGESTVVTLLTQYRGRNPRMDTLGKIAKGLGVEPAEIIMD